MYQDKKLSNFSDKGNEFLSGIFLIMTPLTKVFSKLVVTLNPFASCLQKSNCIIEPYKVFTEYVSACSVLKDTLLKSKYLIKYQNTLLFCFQTIFSENKNTQISCRLVTAR